MRLSAQMARRLQVTSEKVGNLAFLDVTGRIAQTLLNLAKQPGSSCVSKLQVANSDAPMIKRLKKRL